MARPRTPHPTPSELEILKLLWERGPLTVREVVEVEEADQKSRAYTSVMSLMNVMAEKGLVSREPEGRAFRYRPEVTREDTQTQLATDLWSRVYGGATSTLVAHLLEQSQPSEDELNAIRELLARFERPEEAQ
jgi:BlaI family transcriptional regulator, penicillinase repressor